MKFTLILSLLFILSNCSLNTDSKYWKEDVEKRKKTQKKLSEILKKSKEITTMTIEEYKIYIDDFTKTSKYPDINQ